VVTGQAKIAPLSQQNGAYQAVVTSLATEAQNVVIRAAIKDQTLSQVTLRFDPELALDQLPASDSAPLLNWDDKTISLLIGFLIGIFLVGLVLVRVARAK